MSSRFQKRRKWTLWRGHTPRSGKSGSISVRRAGYGGGPATPGVMAPIVGRGGREREREREREKRTLDYSENLD
jgi:hypothetical protein